MIEVLALASAVGGVAKGISAAVKAGKDISSILPAFGKLAKLEADIAIAEQGKHKGPLGRLAPSTQEAFAIASAKMKHKEAMDDLRSTCRLFGPPGLWDQVIFETAKIRKRRADDLKAAATKRDNLFWALSVLLGVAIFAAGAALLVYGAHTIAEEVK